MSIEPLEFRSLDGKVERIGERWPDGIAIDDALWASMVAAPQFTRIEDESVTFIVEQGEAMYYTIEHDKPMGRRILVLARPRETPESTEAGR